MRIQSPGSVFDCARGGRVVAAKAVVVQEERPRRRHLVRLQRPSALGAPRRGCLRSGRVYNSISSEHTTDLIRSDQLCCDQRQAKRQ